MACVDTCPRNAIVVEDSVVALNAVIDEKNCINCNSCYKVCHNNNRPMLRQPVKWYQGWSKNRDIRLKSSSGGYATAISLAFIKNGGYVYSCVFENGGFYFEKASNPNEVYLFCGSKYVKSNPIGVYEQIKRELERGNKILFIGLPCQVASLINFTGNKHIQTLYTIDLVCHGSPSPKLLDLFLKQYKRSLIKTDNILFRVKSKMQIHTDSKGVIEKGVSDKYTIAFLNSLGYTENCYECYYAQKNRVSDITLGDSWGSLLSVEEQKDGISLALCQTEKGIEMIKNADIVLYDVDVHTAMENNHQLVHPSIKHKKHDRFIHNILNGKSFNAQVYLCEPKQCIRQDIKEVLIKFKIIKVKY